MLHLPNSEVMQQETSYYMAVTDLTIRTRCSLCLQAAGNTASARVGKKGHLRCDFTALILTNPTNKWIICKGLKSSLLAELKGRILRKNSPAWHHTNLYVTGTASRSLHINDRTTHNVWQQPLPCREKSVFSAIAVTDRITTQLIAPFICVYSISSGKVRPALWTSGHLARDSLIYIPNGLFIGQQGTNQSY